MALLVKEINGHGNESLDGKYCREVEDGADGEEDSELSSLLPTRRGGIAKNPKKIRQKVQWNDVNGNKLAEVLEFQPSDVSDSDEEEADACVCTIL